MHREADQDWMEAFAETFPLADERRCPAKPDQVKPFLADRIRNEVEHATLDLTAALVRELCQVSPPKDDVVVMAKNAVAKAKAADAWEQRARELKAEVDELKTKLDEAERESNALARCSADATKQLDEAATQRATHKRMIDELCTIADEFFPGEQPASFANVIYCIREGLKLRAKRSRAKARDAA